VAVVLTNRSGAGRARLSERSGDESTRVQSAISSTGRVRCRWADHPGRYETGCLWSDLQASAEPASQGDPMARIRRFHCSPPGFAWNAGEWM